MITRTDPAYGLNYNATYCNGTSPVTNLDQRFAARSITPRRTVVEHVYSDQLATQLQAATYVQFEALKMAFENTVLNNCLTMKTIVYVLQSALIANPTNAMRVILNETYLIARASLGTYPNHRTRTYPN